MKELKESRVKKSVIPVGLIEELYTYMLQASDEEYKYLRRIACGGSTHWSMLGNQDQFVHSRERTNTYTTIHVLAVDLL